MPLIKDVLVGSQIILNGYNNTPATILGADPRGYDHVLIGWKNKPGGGPGWWERNHEIAGIKAIMKDYLWGWWVSSNHEVIVVGMDPSFNATTTTTTTATLMHPQGMQCAIKVCKDFNPYGQPNQPNGKDYVCRSCRESGRKVLP